MNNIPMNSCVLQEDKCSYIISTPSLLLLQNLLFPTVFIQHEYIPNFSTPDQKCPFCTMYSFIENQTLLLKLRLALNSPIMSDWAPSHDLQFSQSCSYRYTPLYLA